jgi:hypothetical protein
MTLKFLEAWDFDEKLLEKKNPHIKYFNEESWSKEVED